MAKHNACKCKHVVRPFKMASEAKRQKKKKIVALCMRIACLDDEVKESERKARTEIGCEQELFFEHDLLEFQ